MNSWNRLLFVLVLGAVCLTVIHPQAVSASTTQPATQPASQPTQGIEQLIAQLGSDAIDDRDAAQQKLISRGTPAVPELKKAAADSEDPEIRSRAGAILTALKDREAMQTSLITLHTQAFPAQQALDAIGSQANAHLFAVGLAVPSPTKPARTVTLDADQKPFWDVMPDVCRQLKILPDLDYHVKNSMRFTPMWADWMNQSPHQIVGPYWIGVQSISHERTLESAISDVPRDKFEVRLIVLGEPKLDVTHLSEFVVTEATDNAGHSLMPRPRAANMPRALLVRSEFLNHTVQIGLTYPEEKPGTLIATLGGDLVVVAAQDFEKYQVDDVMGVPHITNPLSGEDVHTSVVRKGETFEVQIQCTRQHLTENLWGALTNHIGDVALEDVNGHALEVVHPVTIHSLNQAFGSQSFLATGLFKASSTSDPKRLTWTFPNSVKAMKVSVLFHDLKMP